jgi:hypothetical protein
MSIKVNGFEMNEDTYKMINTFCIEHDYNLNEISNYIMQELVLATQIYYRIRILKELNENYQWQDNLKEFKKLEYESFQNFLIEHTSLKVTGLKESELPGSFDEMIQFEISAYTK